MARDLRDEGDDAELLVADDVGRELPQLSGFEVFREVNGA